MPEIARAFLVQETTMSGGRSGRSVEAMGLEPAISAPTIILNAETDSYFPTVDAENEARQIPHAEARNIPSIWGHMALFNPEDQVFIDKALNELLGG
jgi:homoserine acetyltransferase